MKKNLTILAIAILGVIVFAGCSKKSSGSGKSMKATVGTASFSTNNCIFGITSGVLTIYGFNGSSTTPTYPSIVIGLDPYTSGKTGTFTIDDTSFTNFNTADIDSNAVSAAVAQTGTVTITAATATSITGTFSFTCSDGTKVTGGTFTAGSN